jgi:hypothetical protein
MRFTSTTPASVSVRRQSVSPCSWSVRPLPGAWLLALAVVAQLFVACGGTTSRQPRGNPPVTGGAGAGGAPPGNVAGAAGAASSNVAGTGGAPYSNGCQPMDAKASGARCATIAGYRWNGELCEGIACSCVGSDCGRVFASMAECDRAHDRCYAAQGLLRHCARHSDCSLLPRACCTGCGVPTADSYLALGRDALSPVQAMTCLGDPSADCLDCDSGTNPSLYAACIDAQCSVVDVSASASCLIDSDCRLVSKDCCDCGGDFSERGVMSVNYSYERPQRCDGVGCDGCIPNDPSNTFAVCLPDRGACGLITGLH